MLQSRSGGARHIIGEGNGYGVYVRPNERSGYPAALADLREGEAQEKVAGLTDTCDGVADAFAALAALVRVRCSQANSPTQARASLRSAVGYW